jgi:hypothetical protein
MNRFTKVLAVAAMSAAAFSVPMSYADDAAKGSRLVNPMSYADYTANAAFFAKMCDEDKDGMVSKAEAMKMIEKMFDKADTKKMGKLDKKQVETFLKSLMSDSPG